MSKSKACKLKGQQKAFYLHQNWASSCCRAQSNTLDSSHRLEFYLAQWQQERQQLEQGLEIAGCEYCWKQERAGQLSYRLTAQDTNQIEIYLSNLCNQMCSYCSPKFSSTWQDSIEKAGMFENISATARQNLMTEISSADTNYWIEEISNYINTCEDHSVMLKILGGEPLMQQRNLERLLSMNSNKIHTLGIHTNLNPPTDKFLRWLLQNLSAHKLSFTVSIDSSPANNHWPRARFDQNRFDHNLKLLRQHAVPMTVSSVISVLSVFDISNFLNWIQQQNLPVTFTKLYNPECLDPTLIPWHLRQQIWMQVQDKNPPQIVAEILQAPNREDRVRLFEQVDYLKQYFERNALDPAEYSNNLFQQYWSWLIKNTKSSIIKR